MDLSVIDWSDIWIATWETLVMTGVSLFFTILLGLPLGILLFVTAKRQLLEQGFVYMVLSFVVNVLRSVPFLILLIVMIPVTVILIGTSLGVEGAIPPLVVGTAPFFARLVENVLREVDRGLAGGAIDNPDRRGGLEEREDAVEDGLDLRGGGGLVGDGIGGGDAAGLKLGECEGRVGGAGGGRLGHGRGDGERC